MSVPFKQWFGFRPPMPNSITLPSPWRRRGVSVVAAALMLGGLVCARTTSRPVQGGDWSRYHDRSFHVHRVVDGDTLDIDVPDRDKSVTRIRLWGVDTPELGWGRKPDMYYGAEASAFAKRILTDRTVHIVLSPKKTRGKYGRLLAYVFLKRGGRMFNEMLLEEGYAYADLRFPHVYFDRFVRLEKQARRAKVGLWANVTLDKMPPWKQRFERGRGRIKP